MTTTPQAALLREAAQSALITLDGIANANPRDKADFEDKDEWITWAKSRAKWAADKLRAPIAQELYAERVLKQMLEQDAAALSHPAAAKDAEGSGEVVSGVVHCWAVTGLSMMFTGPFAQTDAQEEARRLGGTSKAFRLYTTPPASQPQADHLPDVRKMVALTDEQRYRLLVSNVDRIEASDEFLSEDAKTWAIDPNGIFVGMVYGGRVLRPARRRIKGIGLEVKP